MSYENAVPKPLKFLISDGKMIDDAGNVIAESDTLKELYTKWEPEVKKYLLSDGSVVDENNNVIVKNDWWKAFYDMACPKIAKYLHADGTVDENPGGGSSDLEDNHQTTIDVSTYTQPVEITPSEGKDGMKKATVTLSNIPSGGATAYAWENDVVGTQYTDFNIAPSNKVELLQKKQMYADTSYGEITKLYVSNVQTERNYEKISDSSYKLYDDVDEFIFTRNSSKDFELWEI